MRPFELVSPRSLDEAFRLLDPEDADVRPIAGGTALMQMMKSGWFRPRRLVSLRAIDGGFTAIEPTADGGLRIGGGASLSALEYSPLARQIAPAIVQTLRTLSNVRVRNVATIGGHLAHADPHQDLPPLLVAMGADVRVAAVGGERKVAVAQLHLGYYETVLAGNELITALVLPAQRHARAVYLKCRTRAADDWPALGVAVWTQCDADRARETRIVIGAATEKPQRLTAAEAELTATVPSANQIRHAAEAAAAQAQVTGDQHGSAPYKRHLARVYVERALRVVLQLAPSEGEGHQ